MMRRCGLLLLTPLFAAAIPAVSAQAQYYPAPPPGYYRSGPPPGYDYDDRHGPAFWADDDDDDQPVRRPRSPRTGQVPPPLPYPDEVDAQPLPPPGFVPPGGRRFEEPIPRASDDPDAIRPPGSIGPAPAAAPPAPHQQAQEAAPSTSVMTLPPEDQPETGQPKELPANLKKQLVDYNTKEPAGTLIVDTPNTYLYLVLGGGKAIRYGIGVGREGFTWTGTERISRMKEWPDWFPPSEMIDRQPYLPRMMAGGPGNPLGARALYLGKTLYRIHGTNQPSTIGSFVSSGCIRLLNEDIEDLYSRVQIGTRVVVLPGGKPPETVAATGAAPATVAAPVAAAPQQIAPHDGAAISASPLPPPR